ncbi:cyclin-B2-4-like isoform X2 [Lycium ferocissimum]|uniref:cyclin-B2-4-like isoform X2 n=1 Tax=Lycium ferocissimum TaxID=112874 RepID=UPI002814CE2A|nr:cyclin-B2-4-like isoform X2 [Lycium ferocissimum]
MKLAAQIVTKHLPVPVAPNRNESEDCIIIDAEDYKATGYSAVPMFVQHTEAMMEEIDRMDEEIEMEDWSSVDLLTHAVLIKRTHLRWWNTLTISMLTTRRLRSMDQHPFLTVYAWRIHWKAMRKRTTTIKI